MTAILYPRLTSPFSKVVLSGLKNWPQALLETENPTLSKEKQRQDRDTK
jgi:hypothetical protein